MTAATDPVHLDWSDGTHKPLRAARQKLRLEVTTSGFPRESWWALPGSQADAEADERPVVTPLRSSRDPSCDLSLGERSQLTSLTQQGGKSPGQPSRVSRVSQVPSQGDGSRLEQPTAGDTPQGAPPASGTADPSSGDPATAAPETCQRCGQRLLLVGHGRTVCARCEHEVGAS